jgi:phage shock protein A
MKQNELLSGLSALLEQAKLAERKIEYSQEMERLKRRVTNLEETIEQLKRYIEALHTTR